MHHYFYIGEHNSELHKTIYLQNRRYLPLESDLRTETQFPSQKVETRKPPEKRVYTEVKKNHEAVDNAAQM